MWPLGSGLPLVPVEQLLLGDHRHQGSTLGDSHSRIACADFRAELTKGEILQWTSETR